MPRPHCFKKIAKDPEVTLYKPQGVPLRILETVYVTHEEWEALRLKEYEVMDQTSAAEKMHISQSTFQRLLASARKKVAEALVLGKAIQIHT